MGRFGDNMLIQFSVTSFLIIVAIAVVVSVILSTRLNRNVDLLMDHGSAMMAGQMIKEEFAFSIPSLQNDVNNIRWITIAAVGSGFIILYGSLVMIVWSGSRTIKRQQLEIEEHAGRQVEALNRLLQGRINVLFNEVRSKLSGAKAKPVFRISAEYQEIVEELAALVGSEQTSASTLVDGP